MRELFFVINSNENNVDLPVWHYQKYQQLPCLARGDGPIGKYRKWAKQFYSTPEFGEKPAVSSSVEIL